jgi:hypothetical protein
MPAENWPSLPDAPPGRFQLELAISADGTVDRIVPLCEAPCARPPACMPSWSATGFQPAIWPAGAEPAALEFERGRPGHRRRSGAAPVIRPPEEPRR